MEQKPEEVAAANQSSEIVEMNAGINPQSIMEYFKPDKTSEQNISEMFGKFGPPGFSISENLKA